MPSSHCFNTWGNRRYFHDVYCEQSPYDWLHNHEQILSPSNNSRGFSSSNGYYGYQASVRVPSPCESVHSMDVEADEMSSERLDSEPREVQSRKRPYSNSSDELDVKRIKTGKK